jgi:hypothetical protein
MPSIKIRPAAGQPFEKIPIVKGDKPAHRWIGTALQIENPDGTWGEPVDLKGQPGDGIGDMLKSEYDTDGDGKVNAADNSDKLGGQPPSAYAAAVHNHDLDYEPKNANIQSHIVSPHAPADAQKNSDITQAEIEAKLVNGIKTHYHILTDQGTNPDYTGVQYKLVVVDGQPMLEVVG